MNFKVSFHYVITPIGMHDAWENTISLIPTKCFELVWELHCKNRIVNMTCSLSFWLQMSEPITHIDTDNCMTIHLKGTKLLWFHCSFVHSLKRNDKLSLIMIVAYNYIATCIFHSGCRWVNQLHTWSHISL